MTLFRLALLAASLALPVFAAAQTYPARPVRMIVGFPPGGGTDILARIVAQKLSDAWKQQVVVENRPGASATIAASAVARSAPDGYVLSMGQLTPNAIAPALQAKLPYDVKDFAPIALVGTSPNVLVVYPGLPVRTLAELAAHAKAQTKSLTYASSGAGSLQHIAAELFRSMAGVDLVHVPFKGSAQAVTDLMAGQVDMNFDSIPATIQHIRSGKLRALAVTAAKRAGGGLEEVPTIAESGYSGYDLTTWWGLFAPAGTPGDVLERINADTVAALRATDVRERFASLSVEPGGGTRAEFAAYVRGEITKYDRIVKQLGIKTE